MEIWNRTQEKSLPVDIEFNEHKDKINEEALKELSAKELKRKGDLLDSFFCAYVMLLDYKEISSVEVIGNLEDGYILTLIKDNSKITEYT